MNVALGRLSLASLCFAVAVVGCARTTGGSTASGSSGATLFYPTGTVPPENWKAQRESGIYPADTAKDCCFLAGQAHMTLDNPQGAQRAVFSFYVPAVKPLTERPESVSVAFDGVSSGAPAPLTTGAQDVLVNIPASVRDRAHLTATLTMSYAWVPKDVGLNGDTRHLSVILTKVGYI